MEVEGSKPDEEPEENIYAVAPESDVSLPLCSCYFDAIWIVCNQYVHSEFQSSEEEDSENKKADMLHQPRFIAHVPVPTQKEVEQALLERRKQELIEKYASESLVVQTKEAGAMLGK